MKHNPRAKKDRKRKRQDVRFCLYYALTRNGTQSVIKACIPTNHPRQMAASILRLPHIRKEIAKQYAIVDARLRVPEEQARIAKHDAHIAKLKVRREKAEAAAEALTLKREAEAITLQWKKDTLALKGEEEALPLKRQEEANRVASLGGQRDHFFERWGEKTQRAYIWELCDASPRDYGGSLRRPTPDEFRGNGYKLW